MRDHRRSRENRASSTHDVHGPSEAEASTRRHSPWTQTEHLLFLLGLEEHGRGAWRAIAIDYCVSRTPTQVASHAQKYFLRQELTPSRRHKKRPSIHDITCASINPYATAAQRAHMRGVLKQIVRSGSDMATGGEEIAISASSNTKHLTRSCLPTADPVFGQVFAFARDGAKAAHGAVQAGDAAAFPVAGSPACHYGHVPATHPGSHAGAGAGGGTWMLPGGAIVAMHAQHAKQTGLAAQQQMAFAAICGTQQPRRTSMHAAYRPQQPPQTSMHAANGPTLMQQPMYMAQLPSPQAHPQQEVHEAHMQPMLAPMMTAGARPLQPSGSPTWNADHAAFPDAAGSMPGLQMPQCTPQNFIVRDAASGQWYSPTSAVPAGDAGFQQAGHFMQPANGMQYAHMHQAHRRPHSEAFEQHMPVPQAASAASEAGPHAAMASMPSTGTHHPRQLPGQSLASPGDAGLLAPSKPLSGMERGTKCDNESLADFSQHPRQYAVQWPPVHRHGRALPGQPPGNGAPGRPPTLLSAASGRPSFMARRATETSPPNALPLRPSSDVGDNIHQTGFTESSNTVGLCCGRPSAANVVSGGASGGGSTCGGLLKGSMSSSGVVSGNVPQSATAGDANLCSLSSALVSFRSGAPGDRLTGLSGHSSSAGVAGDAALRSSGTASSPSNVSTNPFNRDDLLPAAYHPAGASAPCITAAASAPNHTAHSGFGLHAPPPPLTCAPPQEEGDDLRSQRQSCRAASPPCSHTGMPSRQCTGEDGNSTGHLLRLSPPPDAALSPGPSEMFAVHSMPQHESAEAFAEYLLGDDRVVPDCLLLGPDVFEKSGSGGTQSPERGISGLGAALDWDAVPKH